ncbi:MAG TPA: hypothetical protein VMV10_27615 [Pirellulales bacterium]|nr:hypothetical protein [Pirellulales bacterium]
MSRKRTQGQEQQEPAATREPGDEEERKPFPPIRPWEHNNLAGVERLFYSNKDLKKYEVWLKFRLFRFQV